MAVQRLLNYPGAKWNRQICRWIIGNIPADHGTYLETHFGSGGVFFNKEPSRLETVNDLDGNVVNLFQVVREKPEELARQVLWTPYSREEYLKSYEPCDEPLEKARRFLVRTWQAIGSKTSDRTGWRSAIQVEKAPHKMFPQQWMDIPESIVQVANRLKSVQIENQDAIQLLERYRFPEVAVYADPPYVMSTRSKRIYRHEMNDEDHMNLLDALEAHPGPVLLSGYANELYDNRLKHWKRETMAATADRGKPRLEVLWINPVAVDRIEQRQMSLF